jgi:hypothetical protein
MCSGNKISWRRSQFHAGKLSLEAVSSCFLTVESPPTLCPLHHFITGPIFSVISPSSHSLFHAPLTPTPHYSYPRAVQVRGETSRYHTRLRRTTADCATTAPSAAHNIIVIVNISSRETSTHVTRPPENCKTSPGGVDGVARTQREVGGGHDGHPQHARPCCMSLDAACTGLGHRDGRQAAWAN